MAFERFGMGTSGGRARHAGRSAPRIRRLRGSRVPDFLGGLVRLLNKEEFLLEDAEVPQDHPEQNEDEDRAPAAAPDLLGSPAGHDRPQ